MPHRKLPHKWLQLWHIGVFSKDPQLRDNCSIAEVQKQYTEDVETDLINTMYPATPPLPLGERVICWCCDRGKLVFVGGRTWNP